MHCCDFIKGRVVVFLCVGRMEEFLSVHPLFASSPLAVYASLLLDRWYSPLCYGEVEVDLFVANVRECVEEEWSDLVVRRLAWHAMFLICISASEDLAADLLWRQRAVYAGRLMYDFYCSIDTCVLED